MLPLEMVYDYDPIPPQPEYSRPPPVAEDEEQLDGTNQAADHVGEAAHSDAMSDCMSDDANTHLDNMSDAGKHNLPSQTPIV